MHWSPLIEEIVLEGLITDVVSILKAISSYLSRDPRYISNLRVVRIPKLAHERGLSPFDLAVASDALEGFVEALWSRQTSLERLVVPSAIVLDVDWYADRVNKLEVSMDEIHCP